MTGNATKSLYTLLRACAPLREIVGDDIYAKAAPADLDGAYVVYHRITSTHDHHLVGTGRLAMARYQLDLWAPTGDQVERMADAIREGLFKFRGTVEGLEIKDIVFESVVDQYEAPTGGNVLGTFGLIVELTIWHEESTPSLVTA